MQNPKDITFMENCFEEHYGQLFKTAYKLTGKKEQAEDVVHESFLKARAGWKNFRGEASVKTWLYRIVINCSYLHIKQINKLPIQLISENRQISELEVYKSLPRTNELEEEILSAEMQEKCLNGFIRCLSAKMRIAFTLKVILDLPSLDVAEIMDTSTNNVKVLVHRARKFLQGLMENRCSLIKKNNPCQCSLWVAWGLEKGIINRDQIKNPTMPRANVTTLKHLPEFYKEMSLLHKILWLHKNSTTEATDKTYLKKSLKNLMKKKELKILS